MSWRTNLPGNGKRFFGLPATGKSPLFYRSLHVVSRSGQTPFIGRDNAVRLFKL
jgi:hypothetical protein